MTADPLAAIIAAWDPDVHPISCANCMHALVSGDACKPMVRCARGHGQAKLLYQLIRPSQPRGFCRARECADYASMDDAGGTEQGVAA